MPVMDETQSAPTSSQSEENPKKVSSRTPYLEATDVDKTLISEGKLTGLPIDYNSKKHLPPSKKHFAEECVYWDFQAAQAKIRVSHCEAEAKSCRELGSIEQRRAAKQLANLKAKMVEVEAYLISQGVDPKSLQKSAE